VQAAPAKEESTMRTRALALSFVLAVLTLPACATTGGGSGTRRNPDLITSEELREVEASTQNLLQVVQRLRPLWLRERGSNFSGESYPPIVYVDGSRYGELNALANIKTSEAESIAYMNPRDATTRFGTGHGGGAIMVRIH
jgi:hypothetical protein